MKLRGVRRPRPARSVPKMPKTQGQKKVDEHMKQIGFKFRKRQPKVK